MVLNPGESTIVRSGPFMMHEGMDGPHNFGVHLITNDPRVPDAQRMLAQLRTEQARGNFKIARYYEKRRKWAAAMIYYNETWVRDPSGPYADEAKQRLDALRKRTGLTAPAT